MAKPIADIDTYVFGTTGIEILAAKGLDGTLYDDLFIYKQYASNSFILQDSTGTIAGKFTLTGKTVDGEILDSSLDADALAETLELGSCCILYTDAASVKHFVEKMLLNKIYITDGSVVYNNAV